MGFKKSISILLSCLILLGSFQQGLDIVIFKLSQSVIIENYCVNKNQKEFKCDGKCHLSKVVAQQQEDNSSEKSFIPEYRCFVFFISENEQLVDCNTDSENEQSYLVTHEQEGHCHTVIKPPIAIS